MDLGLRDRVYIVTGGSRGLGFATARQLVDDGARVVISGLDETEVSRVATKLSTSNAIAVGADNSAATTGDELVAAAVGQFGRLDGALISVGGPPTGSVMDVADQEWRSAFESIFLGAIRIARAVAKTVGQDGSIAFVLSSSVRSPIPGLAISNGLRPGLGMVAKTLSDELGTQGTRVNGLMPAWFATSRASDLVASSGDDPQNSLHRRGTPEEFGRVATFVLSPAASYLTGAMLAIDGGALPTI